PEPQREPGLAAAMERRGPATALDLQPSLLRIPRVARVRGRPHADPRLDRSSSPRARESGLGALSDIAAPARVVRVAVRATAPAHRSRSRAVRGGVAVDLAPDGMAREPSRDPPARQ